MTDITRYSPGTHTHTLRKYSQCSSEGTNEACFPHESLRRNSAFPFPLLTASHSEVKGQGHPQSGASEAKAAPALFYQGRLQEGIPPCVRPWDFPVEGFSPRLKSQEGKPAAAESESVNTQCPPR